MDIQGYSKLFSNKKFKHFYSGFGYNLKTERNYVKFSLAILIATSVARSSVITIKGQWRL